MILVGLLYDLMLDYGWIDGVCIVLFWFWCGLCGKLDDLDSCWCGLVVWGLDIDVLGYYFCV